jgi:hypothetical protein
LSGADALLLYRVADAYLGTALPLQLQRPLRRPFRQRGLNAQLPVKDLHTAKKGIAQGPTFRDLQRYWLTLSIEQRNWSR